MAVMSRHNAPYSRFGTIVPLYHVIICLKFGPGFFRQNTSGCALGVLTLKASPSGWVSSQAQYPMIKIKGLRLVLEGFVVPMHEGACETGSQILTYCSHKPECIGTTNPDRSVLIPIITRHFQFRPVNGNILRLKYEYRARSELVCDVTINRPRTTSATANLGFHSQSSLAV